jgi:hypothetical protein
MPGEDIKTSAKKRVTLSGTSDWSIGLYGIVEFLRIHPVCRAFVAFLGVASTALVVGWFVGLRIPGVSTFGFFLVAPTLLWMWTVSGPSFELVFPVAQASAETQKAEKQFNETQTPEDALNLDFKRLSEYYAINQSQARSSFRWAKFSMLVGFATIIFGIWLFYFRPTQPDRSMSALSAATGCVINIVSGLFLRLHSQTQDRALRYVESLSQLQRLSLAMRLVDAHQNPTEQTLARNVVIRELLASSRK